MGERVTAIRTALGWRPCEWTDLMRRLALIGLHAPGVGDGSDVAALAEAFRLLTRRARLVAIDGELSGLANDLRVGAGLPNASILWAGLGDALEAGADDTWDRLRVEVSRLRALRADADRRRTLLEHLARSAPRMAEIVAGGQHVVDVDRFDLSWTWRRLEVDDVGAFVLDASMPFEDAHPLAKVGTRRSQSSP